MKKTANNHAKKAKILIDMYSSTDVLGSYTGIPEEPWTLPDQDADDL